MSIYNKPTDPGKHHQRRPSPTVERARRGNTEGDQLADEDSRQAAGRRRDDLDRRCRATSSARARAARRRTGARGRRHADRIQHDRDHRRHFDGHAGHERSLISREVIADSIELVADGHCSTPSSCCAVATRPFRPRHGAGASRSSRASCSTAAHCARQIRRQGRDDPGGVRGGRRARRRQTPRRRARARVAACPGAGACGGQFTANTMSMVMRSSASRRSGSTASPRHASGASRARARGRASLRWSSCATITRRATSSRATRFATRSPRRRHRGLDERCVAPARDRARGGYRAEAEDLNEIAAHANHRRPEAETGTSRPK